MRFVHIRNLDSICIRCQRLLPAGTHVLVQHRESFNDERLFTLLRERRSPLLARIPPRWYYELHHATERFDFMRKVRRWAGPRARAAYSRRFG